MINFFKMKKNEWKVKAALYGAIAVILDKSKDISELLEKLTFALQDVPTDELQDAEMKPTESEV